MIRFLLPCLVLIAACEKPETPAERAAIHQASPDGIECALAGGADFARHCRLERATDGTLTIHHPDGGFRRVTTEGAADGADQGSTQPLPDGRLLWTIDRDRYRLPARRP